MSVTPIAAGCPAAQLVTRQPATRQPATRRPAALLRRAWTLVTAWHDRRRAAGHLRSLSDGQLRDLGITRMEIERLVRHGAPRHAAAARRGER